MRGVDPAILAQLQKYSNVLRFAALVDISFVSETLHVWTGYGNLTWGGNTYLGLGHLMGISQVQEDSTVQAQSVTLTLEGITQDDLSEALGDVRQGLPINVWTVLFDTDGKTMVGAPTRTFTGFTDQPVITESPNSCSIAVKCENRMSQLQRPNERRYTQQNQQQLHPSDTGFNRVAQAAWFVGVWGGS